MGVRVSWFGQVIRLSYEGRFRWEEHDAAVQVMNQLMAGVNHPVDLIIEILPGAKLPPGSLQKLGLILRGRYPHWSRRAVVVSQSQIPQMMIELALRVFNRVLVGQDFQFVSSLASAYAALGLAPESMTTQSQAADGRTAEGLAPEIL